jgi:hypothetical protein
MRDWMDHDNVLEVEQDIMHIDGTNGFWLDEAIFIDTSIGFAAEARRHHRKIQNLVYAEELM